MPQLGPQQAHSLSVTRRCVASPWGREGAEAIAPSAGMTSTNESRSEGGFAADSELCLGGWHKGAAPVDHLLAGNGGGSHDARRYGTQVTMDT
jgi:hypothetical protein